MTKMTKMTKKDNIKSKRCNGKTIHGKRCRRKLQKDTYCSIHKFKEDDEDDEDYEKDDIGECTVCKQECNPCSQICRGCAQFNFRLMTNDWVMVN